MLGDSSLLKVRNSGDWATPQTECIVGIDFVLVLVLVFFCEMWSLQFTGLSVECIPPSHNSPVHGEIISTV